MIFFFLIGGTLSVISFVVCLIFVIYQSFYGEDFTLAKHNTNLISRMLGDERIWYSRYNGVSWAAQQIVPGVGTSGDLVAELVNA